MTDQTITYLIIDAYGRTIIEPSEVDRLYGTVADIDAARRVARQIPCVNGVWISPSVWDEDEGGYAGTGLDEEVSPPQETRP